MQQESVYHFTRARDNSKLGNDDTLPGSYHHRKYMVCMVKDFLWWMEIRGDVTNDNRTLKIELLSQLDAGG